MFKMKGRCFNFVEYCHYSYNIQSNIFIQLRSLTMVTKKYTIIRSKVRNTYKL